MQEKVIQVALLGLGTVGGGVYRIIKSQSEEMSNKLGARIEIKKILVRNQEKAKKRIGDDPAIFPRRSLPAGMWSRPIRI